MRRGVSGFRPLAFLIVPRSLADHSTGLLLKTMIGGTPLDFGGASEIPNALVLSLYLVSTSDIVGTPNDTPQDPGSAAAAVHSAEKRAALYQRLCRASAIANEIVSSCTLPWTSGGDPPCFGVHCSLTNDEYLNSTSNLDGDDLWQSRSPSTSSTEENERLYRALQQHKESQVDTFQQPHLRAICRYGNDVNDMWRMISLAFDISTRFHEHEVSLSCAIECWDNHDGQVLLIEAAEHLPSWVDDDVLMHGGVGGPEGCRNRCWIANGAVHLIPPPNRDQSSNSSIEVAAEFSRRDALLALVESLHDGGGGTEAPEAVQCALEHRIARTDYSGIRPKHLNVEDPDGSADDPGNPHWQVAAAALPASVARFIQTNPSLVPLIVDSFCRHAPAYLRERASRKEQQSGDRAGGDDAGRSASLGTLFPFEQVVATPVTMTRANFAELITGRGTVPSFPVPKSYRNVELNRMARRLRQTVVYADDAKKRNPYHRAVDVGIRLCAGLEWVVSAATRSNLQSEDPVTKSLGRVERRIRLYWTRIDTEAGRRKDYDVASQPAREDLPWVEHTWQLGPNGAQSSSEKLLVQALGDMSGTLVFEPELSASLWDEPCPLTRPGISLKKLVKSGMKASLKWQRTECDEYSFPIPGGWEIDDDSWVEVSSLQELENEMKKLSSSRPPKENLTKRRRTNRRRRRITGQDETGEVESDSHFGVLDGVASFIAGEGEVEGVATDRKAATDSSREGGALPLTPKQSISQEVDIDPRKFLGHLHETLRGQGITEKTRNDENSTVAVEDEVTKYFFAEDLDVDDDPGVPSQNGQDSLSFDNIMVRHLLWCFGRKSVAHFCPLACYG